MKKPNLSFFKNFKVDRRPITKKESLICICLILLIAIYLIIPHGVSMHPATETVSYLSFVKKVEHKDVESATIYDDKVVFQLDDGHVMQTDNPDYDQFKEYLLLSGVEVKDGTSISDKLINMTDLLFNLLFFAIIGFGIWKLLDFTGNSFKITKQTDVSFDDICGMDELKREMLSAVDVLKDPERFESLGIRPIKGIVLEGPPGNGKTLFAKALANECDVNFIATKGTDFQSAIMSVGALKIKNLFKKANRHKPCIIFIDEFDGIGERRNYAGTDIDNEVMVIAATNSYHSLDPALIRPGRFDLKFHIGNPDYDTILHLIDHYTKTKALDHEIDVEELAESFDGLSCAAIETIINEAASIAMRQRTRIISADMIREARERTSL